MEKSKIVKHFNTQGPCIQGRDYMVDISGKVAAITTNYIDPGKYFTINRGRQYGKTTTITALENSLGGDYIVASMSFESMGDVNFESEEVFVKTFMKKMGWNNCFVSSFFTLNKYISKKCKSKKIILIVDEVDKSSNLRVFINFLGLLRDKYIDRSKGRCETFHSVILAGVHDVKNIKEKMIRSGVYSPRPEEGTVTYNSPWNIAAPFSLDMSFSPVEIASMLSDYEADHQTGMDIEAMSREIYEWTSGYPFLVSRLCQIIDEDLKAEWTSAGLLKALKRIIREQNTLFDDMIKNMEMYPDLYNYIYDMLIAGVDVRESVLDPVIQRALMFSILRKEEDGIKIDNKIFEKVLMDYFVSKDDRAIRAKTQNSGVLKYDVVKDGCFNMELTLRKFAEHYKRIYADKDVDFWEKHARLIFLSYLVPLINGEGFYHLESQFTDARRMDIVINYGKDEFIIELKLWHGEASEKEAYNQLSAYLKSKNTSTGYLVVFDTRKRRQPKEDWVENEGCRIFEVVL
ncbi:MAG: hypothetical protein LBM77_07690 [Spirochaetaceae bacterium]|jgi:hypothetical protein|nr:hypothetical protein [Spirochaetaceae bacterium]